VVEGTPLLREHLGKTWIGSSNLLVSASYKQASPILYGAFCLINYQYIFVFRPWREARDPKVEYLHY
jgi:hypothetical protein